MALKQAWRERRRLSPALGIKALALAAIFRTGQALGAREAARRRRTTELLPEEVEPDPLYQEDEDEFWQSHELDYPRDTEVFSGVVDRARDDAANEDEFVGRLAPREREVLLMHEVHGVALREVALALAILPAEAEQVLASARRRLRAAGKMVNARPELRSRSSSTAGTKTRAKRAPRIFEQRIVRGPDTTLVSAARWIEREGTFAQRHPSRSRSLSSVLDGHQS